MLCNIDEDSAEEARKILTLLCFSARPLTVLELIDGIAVNVNDPVGLDRLSRLHDADSLREICPGLIYFDIKKDPIPTYVRFDDEGISPTVRIAHFSVQEYLESDRIRKSKAASYALSRNAAHTEIAKICCAYLLDPELNEGSLTNTKLLQFPFAQFSARFWVHHHRNAAGGVSQLKKLVLRIFKEHQESFYNWVKIYDVDKPWELSKIHQSNSSQIPPPEYYASLLGLDWVLHALLDIKREDGGRKSDLGNSHGGHFGNALQAASVGGHEKVIQMLLNVGAEVNAQGGHFGNALQAASEGGHEKVVQMLLDVGADVNAQGGQYGNALQAASGSGHEKVVQMLLDVGAEVNAQGGQYGNALQAASVRGHEKVIQMLLDVGAEVNAQGGYYGNSLQAASGSGHEKVVQMLLDVGADVNAQGGQYGNSLQVASVRVHEKVIQMLLDVGAEVNAQGGYYGNALQAASVRGHEKVIQMLLDVGAEVNAQGGVYGNALQAASGSGHEKVVQMLLDVGAEVNAQGGVYGNALQAASEGGHEKVVQVLLDARRVEDNFESVTKSSTRY
jgi:ankyrin repeat protein